MSFIAMSILDFFVPGPGDRGPRGHGHDSESVAEESEEGSVGVEGTGGVQIQRVALVVEDQGVGKCSFDSDGLDTIVGYEKVVG